MSAKHLVERPVGVVLHAIKNPLSTASYGIGLVRGAAAALVRAASGGGGPAHAEWIAPPEPMTEEEALADAAPEESGVLLGENVEPAPEREPEDPGEAFVTEPSAVNRDSAYGGSASVDEQIDDWYDDSDDAADSVIEALEMGDALPDDGPTPKAILSEAETLRRAANGGVDPGDRS